MVRVHIMLFSFNTDLTLSDLLKLIFDHIYEEDLISEQTFYKWETDQNPLESEGKGVTLLSVRSFLTWLHEAENESDE